ncbi:unnamed protein product [Sphacelaria rigidula]
MVHSATMLAAAGLTTVAIFQTLPSEVDGHAYLMSPVSRNFYYTNVFQSDNFEDIEYCPHCLQGRGPKATRERGMKKTPRDILDEWGGGEWPGMAAYYNDRLAENGNFLEPDEIAVRHGVCGDPEQNADEVSNTYSRENKHYPVLDSYEEGTIIEMKVAMSVYHWGHLEFFICNSEDQSDGPEGVVNQGCFNMYPLTRASDDSDASPIDPDYPGRYYVDPPCREDETDQTKPDGAEPGPINTARYQLPEGLICERCIVQMVYYTSHKCTYPGYREFNPPSWPSGCADNKEAWFDLGPELCEDGLYPEEFWNCADISITPRGGSRPRPSPTPDSDDSNDRNFAEILSQPESVPAPAPEEAPEPTPEPEVITNNTGGGDCAKTWKQCDGEGFEGPHCCGDGEECEFKNTWYSQCVPV